MNSTKAAANALLFILTLFIIFAMFIMKNTVHDMEDELRTVTSDIEKNIQAIHLLKAEWSYLNRPSRIRELASKYTPLNNVDAKQIINYSALPFKYENKNPSRRLIAQQNISQQAERNKNLKHLVRAQR